MKISIYGVTGITAELLNFNFENGTKWLQFFPCGTNFSHLAKLVAQDEKIQGGTLIVFNPLPHMSILGSSY